MSEIKGSYTFDAEHQTVWNALQNPRLLAIIIPSCWGIESIGEHSFRGKMQFSVGPMSSVFDGNINLTNLQAPDSYDAVVRGSAAIGIVKLTGSMNLETASENQTTMHYSGEAVFSGRIAGVGLRLLDASMKTILKQSLDALNQYFVSQSKDKPEQKIDN